MSLEEYVEERYAYDKRHHSCHEMAIVSINQLNRVLKANNLEPLCKDGLSRREIGDVCGKILSEYYTERE